MKKNLRIMIILGFSLMAVISRLFYLNVPFERDEGAYAYVSDTIDRGGLPYVDAFDHKPPIIYYIYNLSFKLFGRSIASPRIMAALFLIPTCWFVFQIVYFATEIFIAGLASILFLGIVSSSPAYTGFTANTELFMLPFLLGGSYFLLEQNGSYKSSLVPGLFLGVAMMIKQAAAPIMLSGLAILVLRNRERYNKYIVQMILFSLGCIAPFFIILFYFVLKGHFDDFWICFFTYNFSYVSNSTIFDAYRFFSGSMIRNFIMDPIPWIAWYIGLFLLLKSTSIDSFKGVKGYLLLLMTGAAAGVALGKRFY